MCTVRHGVTGVMCWRSGPGLGHLVNGATIDPVLARRCTTIADPPAASPATAVRRPDADVLGGTDDDHLAWRCPRAPAQPRFPSIQRAMMRAEVAERSPAAVLARATAAQCQAFLQAASATCCRHWPVHGRFHGVRSTSMRYETSPWPADATFHDGVQASSAIRASPGGARYPAARSPVAGMKRRVGLSGWWPPRLAPWVSHSSGWCSRQKPGEPSKARPK